MNRASAPPPDRWPGRWTSKSRADPEPSAACSRGLTIYSFMQIGVPATGFIFGYEERFARRTGVPALVRRTLSQPGRRHQSALDPPAAAKFNDFFAVWSKWWRTLRSAPSGVQAASSRMLTSGSVGLAALLTAATLLPGQPFTRGVGVYPGDPAQDFGPVLAPDSTYRNSPCTVPPTSPALTITTLRCNWSPTGSRRPRFPAGFPLPHRNGLARKNERELLLDHNPSPP